MSLKKYQRKLETAVIENGLLLIQSKLKSGETKTVSRPYLCGFLEPASQRNGHGHDLSSVIKDAIVGRPGFKYIQKDTGHKQVFVEITGL